MSFFPSKKSPVLRFVFLLTVAAATQSLAAIIPDTIGDLAAEPTRTGGAKLNRSLPSHTWSDADPLTNQVCFNVPAGSSFSLVINSGSTNNHGNRHFYTEYPRNTDPSLAINHDHYVMRQTSRGLKFTAEDVRHISSTRVLDDRDFTDDLIDLFTYDDNSPAIDEPKPTPSLKSFSIMPLAVLGLVFNRTVYRTRPNQRD